MYSNHSGPELTRDRELEGPVVNKASIPYPDRMANGHAARAGPGVALVHCSLLCIYLSVLVLHASLAHTFV